MKTPSRNFFLKALYALSKQERLVLLCAVIIFAISSLTYGVLVYKTKTYAIPTQGGTYREGILQQPSFVNPIIPTTETDRAISRLIFSSLEEMAESIKQSADGKTWNVRLYDNILWHDGDKVTADDVVFTVDTIFVNILLIQFASQSQEEDVGNIIEKKT